MSAHVGIQFHAAPSEPQLMTGTRFLSLGGIVSKKKEALESTQTRHTWMAIENKYQTWCVYS